MFLSNDSAMKGHVMTATNPIEQDLEQLNAWASRAALRKNGRTQSPRTAYSRASRLRVLAETVGANSLEEFADHLADPGNVVKLHDELWQRYSPSTIRTVMDALIVFSRYAVERGWLSEPPVSGHDRPQAPAKPIEVYDPDDVALLLRLAKVNDIRWWAFLTTLADTGRRVSEVLALQWDWLALEAEPPHFTLPTSKNHRQQFIPLSRRLVFEVYTPENMGRMKHLKPRFHEQFHRDQAVYPFPWSYSVVRNRFITDCKRADVPYRGFHNFRHTKATELLARGVPIQAVSALLGHSSVATTDRVYNHTSSLQFAHYLQ